LEGKCLSDDGPQKAKEPVDYSGLKIGAILAPVVLLFSYFGKADTGLAVFIVLGVMTVAIKIRWNLRKHVWFWAVIVLIFALHVPLFFVVRWPQGTVPTIFYVMPVGIADFLVISGTLNLAEKFLSKVPPSENVR
jgi:hypothetical protein